MQGSIALSIKSSIMVHYLFHLESDGGLDLIHLLLEVVVVSEESGEFPRLAQTRPQETRDLLDQTV